MPIIPKSFTGTICCWMLPSRLVPPCTVPVAGPLVSDLPGMGMARASGRSAQARQGCRLLQRRCGTGHLRVVCPVSGTGRAAGRAYRIFFSGHGHVPPAAMSLPGHGLPEQRLCGFGRHDLGQVLPQEPGRRAFFPLWRKRVPYCSLPLRLAFSLLLS